MKIATWNINSVRARVDRLIEWLKTRDVDVLCLQETKCTDDQFPTLEVQAAGYRSMLFGQKSYNGVAILSKEPVSDVRRNMGNEDEQARIISAIADGVRVVGLYAPNGQNIGSEAYQYKLDWYAALSRWLPFAKGTPLLVCGDFNVAPEELDVWDPRLFSGHVLFTPKERAALKQLMTDHGLVDLLRAKHPDEPHYTWWDYREGGFRKNKGLRIDHLLVTADLVERCTSIVVDRDAREGKLPSDHAPVIATFR